MIDLEHIGIAVKDVAKVDKLFAELLGAEAYKSEEVASQGVKTHFIDAGGAKIELLESLSESSPIARYLDKHGEGIHHLAFEVPDIQAAWQHVLQQGFEPIGEGPSPGADGKSIFFLHPRQTHGMLLEFCQSMPVEFEPEWIATYAGRLAVFDLGNPAAPPVVVLHGAAGCTHMETLTLARRLSGSYRVLALDFAGHGLSDAFEDLTFTPECFVDNVTTVLNHFELEQTDLFGFSLGGFIALSFAANHPNRVRKLAVHATNLFWDAGLEGRMLGRLDVETIKNERPELARYLSDMHGAEKWELLFERMKTYTRSLPDFEAQYGYAREITAPTLVSAVHDDDLFSIDSPVELHKLLTKSTLAIIPGRRHAIQNLGPGSVFADLVSTSERPFVRGLRFPVCCLQFAVRGLLFTVAVLKLWTRWTGQTSFMQVNPVYKVYPVHRTKKPRNPDQVRGKLQPRTENRKPNTENPCRFSALLTSTTNSPTCRHGPACISIKMRKGRFYT